MNNQTNYDNKIIGIVIRIRCCIQIQIDMIDDFVLFLYLKAATKKNIIL